MYYAVHAGKTGLATFASERARTHRAPGPVRLTSSRGRIAFIGAHETPRRDWSIYILHREQQRHKCTCGIYTPTYKQRSQSRSERPFNMILMFLRRLLSRDIIATHTHSGFSRNP